MTASLGQIVEILNRYARECVDPMLPETPLAALDIDRLDLPMIALDLEDAFNMRVGIEEGIHEALTVGDVMMCVERGREARSQFIASRSTVIRVKRSWTETDARG